MSRYVIDANVAIKWFLPLSSEENHVTQALHLLSAFTEGEIECYQPAHFISEVIAVLTRLRPNEAHANLTDLLNMDFHRVENAKSYAKACTLSMQLKHHLFDTLYHAIALETPGAIFITADEIYYHKACSLGQIQLLQDYIA
jgi:predicted nucleic acid-binding protein